MGPRFTGTIATPRSAALACVVLVRAPCAQIPHLHNGIDVGGAWNITRASATFNDRIDQMLARSGYNIKYPAKLTGTAGVIV